MPVPEKNKYVQFFYFLSKSLNYPITIKNKLIKKLVFITTSALLLFTACKGKQGTTEADAACNACEDAIIRNYGDPALDGCGWVVDVSSTIYMPQNLDSEFHEDNLKVRIKYKELERVNCGLVKDAHLGMYIEEIYKQ